MPKKRHKPEEIVAKLRQVDVWCHKARARPTLFARLRCDRVTYYRWRQEYCGLRTDQVKRLKRLGTENVRLRKAISDLTLTS